MLVPVLVVTVTVETPPFSEMEPGATPSVGTGATSSSVMVMPCCVPTAAAPMAASMRMSSASSSMMSLMPVTVVLTMETSSPSIPSSPKPAGRVRDLDTML